MPRRVRAVAVTGLNATDNPGPGVGVIRALRHDLHFDSRIVGLAYDALEPGVYAADLVDDVFLIPYPSQGVDALRERLAFIRARVPFDVVIPTLDAELPGFIELAPELARMGVGTFLPTREQLELRSKAKLAALAARSFPVPKTTVITDVSPLYSIHESFEYPIVVKGPFYGAKIARSLDEAVHAFHAIVAEWGLPVVVQEFVAGTELCVLAVGDGSGGLVGAIQMRKTVLTDKGKGWAGVAIRDPGLAELTKTFMQATRWRGPCELEVIRDAGGGYHVLEVNPRFPAWCYLSAGAGMNLPRAVARLAAGEEVDPMTDYRVGTMFVRIALDQVVDVRDFASISTNGEIVRSESSSFESLGLGVLS